MENLHADLGLTDEDVLHMYEKILLTRMIDERTWILNRMGKVHFLVSAQGQEAAQIGSAFALRPKIDWALPYYRDLGVVLHLGMTPEEIFLGMFAKATDPNSGGRQMPSHWGHRGLNIFTGGSPVATQLPHATGVAYGAKLKGDDIVVWTSLGEGSTSKGDAHEAMNFAGVHKLPVIFCVENNGYAISVPQEKQMAIENVADRAPGYGFPGVVVDGMNPFDVYKVTKEAVERARAGEGPTLIEAKVYRFTPHSSDDDDRSYRTRDEVDEWREKDPVRFMRDYVLGHNMMTEEENEALIKRLEARIDAAVEYAEDAPNPKPEDLTAHVYAQ